MLSKSDFGAFRAYAWASVSLVALASLPAIARAQCTPNPAQSQTTTTCTGVETGGLVVATSGSTVNINAGGTVSSANANTSAITITSGGTPFTYTYSSNITDNGTVDGASQAGITVTNAPYTALNGYGTTQAYITVGQGGVVQGSNGIVVAADPSTPFYASDSVSLTNAGKISGSGGAALYAPNPATGFFSSINNQAGGQIGAIVGQVGTLTNAGVIDGGSASALSALANPQYGGPSVTNSATGVITSSGAGPTIWLASTNYGVTVANSGLIANTGGGAAISAANALNLTNVGGVINGNIIVGGPSSTLASTIDNTGGTINGAIILGAANNRVIADFGTSANPISGISGAITSGGGYNTLQLNFTSNVTLTSPITPPSAFQQVTYGLGNGAQLTFAAGSNATSTVAVAGESGGGTLINNGTITTTGSAIAADVIGQLATVGVTNNGSITATLPQFGGYAIDSSGYGLGQIVNTGRITAIGGGGISAGPTATVTNSGSITADTVALNTFDSTVTNSGTLHSNQGVGFYASGNVGTPATNTGVIYGQTIGAQLDGYTLTNSGTISSPGLGVAVDPYGSLVNQAGGVINGGVGAALYSYTYNASISNAGTINGNVNFGSNIYSNPTKNDFISLPGGIVNGNLVLGSGGDIFATSINNSGSSKIPGVTGTITGGGAETIRYLVTSNSTASVSLPAPFSLVGYDLSNNATLNLSLGTSQISNLGFAGAGSVNLTGNLTGTAATPLLDLTQASVQTTGSSNTIQPTQINLTSYGNLTQTNNTASTPYYYSPAPAVQLSGTSSFTNAGMISVQDLAPSTFGLSLAGVYGAGVVTNSGTISVAAAYGILGSTYGGGPLSVTNTGLITQVAGGADGVGIAYATTVTNSGMISVGGDAVVLGPPYIGGGTLTNSGKITSLNGIAVSSSNLYGNDLFSSVINQSSGIITGLTGINLSGGGVVDNAGVINGDVILGAEYYDSSQNIYVNRNGILNGNLTFESGNDIFVSLGSSISATGVTGVITAGSGGVNTFAQGYTATTTVTPSLPTSVTNFQSVGIGAVGTDVTVTVNNVSGGLNSPPLFFGTGTIINNADVNTSQTSTPNTVLLGVASAAATSSSLNFVNNANLADGIAGTASAFTNTGSIGTSALTQSAASLMAATSESFSFNNSGKITVATNPQYFSYYSYFINPAISISPTDPTVSLNNATLTNSGSISGAVGLYLAANNFAFSNSGVITSGGYEGAALNLDVTGAQVSSPTTIIALLDQQNLSVANSGTIVGGLSLASQSDNLSLTNNGAISDASETAYSIFTPAVSISNTTTQAQTVSLTTSGSITSSEEGEPAVFVDASSGQSASVTVTNSGAIHADAGSVLYPAPLYYNPNQPIGPNLLANAGLAIIASGQTGASANVTNSAGGVISSVGPMVDATSTTGAAVAGTNAGDGSIALFVSANTVSIVNAGKIIGGAGYSLPAGVVVSLDGQPIAPTDQYLAGAIQTLATTTSVVNTSTGVINGSIDLGGTATSLANYGAITGDVYLQGTSHFIEGINASFQGTAYASASGANALTIDVTGGGSLSQALFNPFINFQTIDLSGSGVAQLSGSISLPVPTLTLDKGVGLVIGSGLVLTGNVAVDADATLSGHGEVIGNVVNTGGTVHPGGSIGVLTINGNYTQTAGGVLSVEATPSAASLLRVSGTATLAGELELVTDSGVYRKGEQYTVLTAGSTVGGFTSAVASNGLPISLASQGGGLTATFTQSNFTVTGGTANENAVGAAFANYPVGVSDFDPVANALLALQTSRQQNAALDTLGGEVDADLQTAARDSTRLVLSAIEDQLSGAARPDLSGRTNQDQMVWGKAFGQFGQLDGDSQGHGYSTNTGGVIAGVQSGVSAQATVGATVSYSHTDIALSGLTQSGGLDSGAVSVYGERRSGVLFADAAASVTFDHGDSERRIALPGVSRQAAGSFNGYTDGFWGSVGARLHAGLGVALEPSLGVSYGRVEQGGFTEDGATGADLRVKAASEQTAQSLINLRVTKTVRIGDGTLSFQARASQTHEFSSVRPAVIESFAAQSGTDFALVGAKADRDAEILGVGLDYQASKTLSFFSHYEEIVGARDVERYVTLGGRYVW